MIRRAILPSLGLTLLIAGCTAPAPHLTISAPVAVKPTNLHEAGLERVLGRSAPELVALFGEADLDGREGQARRLQFAGPVCVLDAYLYPPKAGAEPIVTYIDARLPTGDDIDRASCVAALSRRAVAP